MINGTIEIEIKGKKYTVNLLTGQIWAYEFSAGSDEDGDIEGHEIVGRVIKEAAI